MTSDPDDMGQRDRALPSRIPHGAGRLGRVASIGDTEVGLAFYGSIVYVALVAVLGAQRPPFDPMAAVSATVGTSSVLYLAHVFAGLVPKAARSGALTVRHIVHELRHDLPLLLCVAVPVSPLLLAAWGAVDTTTAYDVSVRLTLALLFVLTVMLSRREGLRWGRAVGAGTVILASTVAITWLETQVH